MVVRDKLSFFPSADWEIPRDLRRLDNFDPKREFKRSAEISTVKTRNQQ